VLVIETPVLSPEKFAELHAGLIAQAKRGIVLLSPPLKLLNAQTADEKILVIQEPAAEGMVQVKTEEWQEIADYIATQSDCATCKHDPDGTVCLACECDCGACTVAGCSCRTCHNGSAWEWRHGHGKE
jgi:hypothetical protein